MYGMTVAVTFCSTRSTGLGYESVVGTILMVQLRQPSAVFPMSREGVVVRVDERVEVEGVEEIEELLYVVAGRC